MIKIPNFEVVDPVASITKVGAGANLYAIADKGDGVFDLVPVASLPLREVVEISDAGKRFIEIKK